MTEATSRTDEEIVKDAFKHVGLGPMDDDEDEDEDEIVWNPKAVSPVLSPLVQASPVTPLKSLGGSVGHVQSGTGIPYHSSLSPKQSALKTPMASPRAKPHALNALDLLQNVIKVGQNPGAGISLDSPRPNPPLLYGSDLSHQSIWTASRDEQLKLGGGPGHLGVQTSPRSFPHSLSAPQETLSTPSTWSSQTTRTPNMTFQSPGHMHQTSYSSPLAPLQNGATNQHYRVHSASQSPGSPLSHSQYGNVPFNDPAIQAVAPQAPHPQTSLQHIYPQHPQPFLQQHHQSPSFNQYYDPPVDQGHGYPSHLHHDPGSASQSFTSSLLWGKVG